MSVCNFVYSMDLEGSCGQYSLTNCRCDVSAIENRCGDFRRSMYRPSKIDVTMCRPSKIDDRRVDLRRSVIGVDLRRSVIDVSIFEDRCEIRLLYLLKTLILYISCMRITPRVCTSVLSL